MLNERIQEARNIINHSISFAVNVNTSMAFFYVLGRGSVKLTDNECIELARASPVSYNDIRKDFPVKD